MVFSSIQLLLRLELFHHSRFDLILYSTSSRLPTQKRS